MDFRRIWFYFVADNVIAKPPLVINRAENQESFLFLLLVIPTSLFRKTNENRNAA